MKSKQHNSFNKIVQHGKSFSQLSGDQILDKLEPGNYVVKFNDMASRFYLDRTNAFDTPEKMYDDPDKMALRYLTTFNKHGKNLGVLLRGAKGSGKTLLAKRVCMLSNLPVLLVNESYVGTSFNEFIANFNQPLVMFFDEFEKVYPNSYNSEDESPQVKLLTLLDGTVKSQILFLFTVNNEHKLHDAFMNRPSRIHYSKGYTGLSDEVISGVIADKLENLSELESLFDIAKMLNFNLDTLISVIREMNDFNIGVKEAVAYMNIRIEEAEYRVVVQITLPDQTTVWYSRIREELDLTGPFYISVNYDDHMNGGMRYHEYAAKRKEVATSSGEERYLELYESFDISSDTIKSHMKPPKSDKNKKGTVEFELENVKCTAFSNLRASTNSTQKPRELSFQDLVSKAESKRNSPGRTTDVCNMKITLTPMSNEYNGMMGGGLALIF
jgi:hypothetical protein